MDLSAPDRKRSMAISDSSESSFASAATISNCSAEDNIRPSAEEWYPRLHLGWNHKECVDVYCYFKSRPYSADFKIEWAIHPLGPPFHGKGNPISFEHILQLVGTKSNSGMVKKAIVIGLSTQYHWQNKFKENTPVYEQVEPTPKEILTSWENHSLNTSEDENAEKVKNDVMSTFGFYITKDKVKLLQGFSALKKISVFETNTWRQLMCFKCCPAKDTPSSPDSPISPKENPRKRKNDGSHDKDQPGPKRLALPASEEDASSRDVTRSTTTKAGPVSTLSKATEAAPQVTTPSADPISTRVADANQPQNTPGEIGAGAEIPSTTHETLTSPAFSTTLIISSWLRLLPTVTLDSGNTSSIIQKWLKDSFAIDVTWEDISKMTDSAKADNISPLQTTVFKCTVATVREDLGAILMNPHIPTGIDAARRGSLRGLSGNVEASVRRASGGGRSESSGTISSGTTTISNCA
ncbi:hypothetical protein IFR05_003276 [Cadophora sp. M221]|nr:hypothetical protein IFR05_003276 [Cadophora sp. M221]